MKVLRRKPFIIILVVLMRLFASCTGNASFSQNEIRFTAAFKKDQVVIYKSSLGQIDSIKFFKRERDTVKHRNFSQGFYNENILRVKYQLLNNSYHKMDYGGGLSSYELVDDFLSFLESKNGHSAKEIGFLGLLFDEDYVNKMLETKESILVFSNQNARYQAVNINEGIKSFKFDFSRGVVSFIDTHGIQWVRMN